MTNDEWKLYEGAIRETVLDAPYLKFTLSTWVTLVQFIEAQRSIGVEINRDWLHKELELRGVVIPDKLKRKRRAIQIKTKQHSN